MHLVGCLYYLYQWCMVKQISNNEIYLLIKYIKSVLWRVAKRLSYTEDARCLKVKRKFVNTWVRKGPLSARLFRYFLGELMDPLQNTENIWMWWTPFTYRIQSDSSFSCNQWYVQTGIRKATYEIKNGTQFPLYQNNTSHSTMKIKYQCYIWCFSFSSVYDGQYENSQSQHKTFFSVSRPDAASASTGPSQSPAELSPTSATWTPTSSVTPLLPL